VVGVSVRDDDITARSSSLLQAAPASRRSSWILSGWIIAMLANHAADSASWRRCLARTT